MTPAQLLTLRTAIDNTPAWAATPNNGDGHVDLAALLNAPATPAYYVKRSTLTRHEIVTGTSDDNTTFSWAAGGYITRAQGERDAFREMFNSTGTVNPWLPSILAAFADIFSGAGGLGNRNHITAMSRRLGSEVEKVMKTAGAGTKADPATMGFESPVTPSLIQQARDLPI